MNDEIVRRWKVRVGQEREKDERGCSAEKIRQKVKKDTVE